MTRVYTLVIINVHEIASHYLVVARIEPHPLRYPSCDCLSSTSSFRPSLSYVEGHQPFPTNVWGVISSGMTGLLTCMSSKPLRLSFSPPNPRPKFHPQKKNRQEDRWNFIIGSLPWRSMQNISHTLWESAHWKFYMYLAKPKSYGPLYCKIFMPQNSRDK